MSELKLQQCRLDGRYDVLDCLGRGSYAEVYVAHDAAAAEGAPRTVVIKALNSFLQGAPDPELERTLIENFRNEAAALDRVRHPNIISRLGHGTAIDLQSRTFQYLVLEYLPGGDLQALCRQQPLPFDKALFYLEQVCAGLDHAHEHGVIHRDIKPQNLLLTADRKTVKIADFGVAKIEATEGAITRVGTDVYAAPEHHPLAQTGPLDTAALQRPKPHLTPAADVYSLAKTAYMLLTGEAPRRFSQKPISALPEHVQGEPWAAFVLRVLNRATQTNSASRYQTVRDFWAELRDAAMPKTRLLSQQGGGSVDNQTSPPSLPREKFDKPQLATPVPQPAAFTHSYDRPAAAADTHSRPRIVVPISEKAPLERVAPNESQAIAAVVAHRREVQRVEKPAKAEGADKTDATFNPSSRVRRWLVAALLIAAFAGMLLATHNYVRGLRPAGASTARPASNNTTETVSPVGRQWVTTTNVNLRQGPSSSTGIVRVVEKDSRVKVVNVRGKWYEVVVLESTFLNDARETSDRGWVNSDNLRLN